MEVILEDGSGQVSMLIRRYDAGGTLELTNLSMYNLNVLVIGGFMREQASSSFENVNGKD